MREQPLLCHPFTVLSWVLTSAKGVVRRTWTVACQVLIGRVWVCTLCKFPFPEKLGQKEKPKRGETAGQRVEVQIFDGVVVGFLSWFLFYFFYCWHHFWTNKHISFWKCRGLTIIYFFFLYYFCFTFAEALLLNWEVSVKTINFWHHLRGCKHGWLGWLASQIDLSHDSSARVQRCIS